MLYSKNYFAKAAKKQRIVGKDFFVSKLKIIHKKREAYDYLP